jgi:hypothetical protein
VVTRAGQGTYPGGANGLKVTASTVYRPSFAAVLGLGAFHIAASATANITTDSGNAMILALSSAACPGMKATGSGSVTANGGNIQVNSNCSEALRQTGTGMLRAINGAINVTGHYSQVGSGGATPTPHNNMPVVPDPLENLPVPTKPPESLRRGAGTSAKPKTFLITGSSSTTLEPGLYYGGIKMTGSGNLTLRGGIYYIAGGELTLVGSGNIIAEGVFFYLTNDPEKPTVDGKYAPFTFAGSAGSRLRPMSSGTYKNITVFQDRANTAEASVTGSGNNMSGTLYFHSANAKAAGSAQWSGAVQLIADTIETHGTSDVTWTWDPSQLFGVPKATITK